MNRLAAGTLALATLTAVVAPLPVRSQPSPLLGQNSTQIQTVNPSDSTLYLNNNATVVHSLRTSSPIQLGTFSVPAGATVRGQFEPVDGGLRYVASGVEFNSRIYAVQATSGTLHDVKDPRETSVGSVIGDAAIGAAGGAVVGSILGGGVSVGEVIGGAAAGAIIGNVTAQRVVVVEPNQALDLTVQ